jgi:hypothetical protein
LQQNNEITLTPNACPTHSNLPALTARVRACPQLGINQRLRTEEHVHKSRPKHSNNCFTRQSVNLELGTWNNVVAAHRSVQVLQSLQVCPIQTNPWPLTTTLSYLATDINLNPCEPKPSCYGGLYACRHRSVHTSYIQNVVGKHRFKTKTHVLLQEKMRHGFQNVKITQSQSECQDHSISIRMSRSLYLRHFAALNPFKNELIWCC